MKIKHALSLKGFIALALGVTVVATSCKKDQSPELQASELNQDSLLSKSQPLQMATGTVSSGNLQFESGFEESNSILNSSWGYNAANSNSITRSTEQTRAGISSAKFILNKSDALISGSKRAELQFNEPLTTATADRWFGLSVYLPTSFVADAIPESIFQWHNVPNFGWGETWATSKPENPLHMETINGRYVLVHVTSSVPSDTNSPRVIKKYDLGEYKTGVWTDWVIHWKLSSKTDGVLQVWKNGQVVFTLNGPTYYNDINGPYMKIGIYKWGWAMNIPNTTSQRVIYIDQFKVGNANATYNDVAPSATTPTTTTPTTTTPTTTTPTTTNTGVVFAVNSGGSAFTASNGITYEADKYYSGGGVYAVNRYILNTTDDKLYQSERYNKTLSYDIPLANGNYEITFKFAEKYYRTSGIRQFDVLSEGREIISNLDVFKAAGGIDKAYDVVRTVSVIDGKLNINFRNDKDLAIISAIHVKKI